MKKIFAIILLLGFWTNLMAQEDTLDFETKIDNMGVFYELVMDFPIINTDALNEQLSNFEFPQANYRTTNFGFGLQLHISRAIISFAFCKGTKTDEQTNYVTQVEYRSTSLNVGYDLLKNTHFSLYPYIGFKGCGLNYLYKDIIPDEAFFSQYFGTNLQYKEISNSRGHLDLGIGFSHQWFYLINFRAGYLLPLEKVQWTINNGKTALSKSPTIDYQYYFSLRIGLGYIEGNRKKRHTENETYNL
ncbi:MAG: hypothetical protein FWC39_01530 [Bacteroidetes bacterium]|nr:hypothetical protein [Bacteroidota bacterium]